MGRSEIQRSQIQKDFHRREVQISQIYCLFSCSLCYLSSINGQNDRFESKHENRQVIPLALSDFDWLIQVVFFLFSGISSTDDASVRFVTQSTFRPSTIVGSSPSLSSCLLHQTDNGCFMFECIARHMIKKQQRRIWNRKCCRQSHTKTYKSMKWTKLMDSKAKKRQNKKLIEKYNYFTPFACNKIVEWHDFQTRPFLTLLGRFELLFLWLLLFCSIPLLFSLCIFTLIGKQTPSANKCNRRQSYNSKYAFRVSISIHRCVVWFLVDCNQATTTFKSSLNLLKIVRPSTFFVRLKCLCLTARQTRALVRNDYFSL